VTDTVRSDPASSQPAGSDPTQSPARPATASWSGRTVRARASRLPQRGPRTWAGRLSILAGSAAIALGVSDAINRWFLAPGGLQASTDVVGYPTVRNFDAVHYVELFALAAVVFPVVLGVSFLVLDRVLPRLIARFGRQALVNGSGVAARLAIPGVALGLGAAVAGEVVGQGSVAAYLAVGAAAYGGAVAVATLLVERLRPGQSYLFRLSEANVVAVPVSLLALAAVSATAGVGVTVTDTVERHPFLPWPLAVLGMVVVVAVVAWRLRAAGPGLEDRRAFERDVVAIVAGSVIVFLLTARLPGSLGSMDTFHEGEFLATPALVRDGAFPWRDLLFIHGLLQDALSSMLGHAVFGDTRWGAVAGSEMLAVPLCFVFSWILLARAIRSNWAILAGYPLLLAAGTDFFGGLVYRSVTLRLAFLPLVVLLAIRAMRSAAIGWSVGLGVAMLAAFVLTPEFAVVLVALAAAVIAHDWVEGPGLRWRARFARTLGCAAGALAAAAAFSLWLGANGALDDFVFYFRTFAPNHELTGGSAIEFQGNGFTYLVAAVLPWALAVVAGVYVAWRLASRRVLRAADWAMGSLVLAGLLFYPKFLARPDAHVYVHVVFALPVLIYALARGLEPGDRDLADAAPGRSPRHALSLLVVGALLMTAVSPALQALGAVPGKFVPGSVAAAEVDRLGYAADALPTGLLEDTRAVIEAVGPDARVFDFTNQPAVLYYLLRQPSPTRYFHVSMAIRERNQTDLIDELEADPPELVLYWSTESGLPFWDGITNQVRHYDVSQYILENYRPWVSVRGQLFYLRNDIDPPDTAALAAEVSSAPHTDQLRDELPPCDWGTAPVFLDSADQVGTEGRRLATEPMVSELRSFGWVAPVGGQVPERVLAARSDGTVISEAPANVRRPDLAAWAPESIASGFSIVTPLAAGETPGDIHLVGVTARGAAAAVGDSPPLPTGTELRYSGDRRAVVVPATAPGSIDGTGVEGVPDDRSLVRIEVPAGGIADHDWLEMNLDGEPADGRFLLTNTPGNDDPDVGGRPVGQGILFETLDRETDRYLVQAASCPQWQGFQGGPLYLSSTIPVDVALTLQRSLDRPG
jgi:hypothetical protein